MVVGGWLVVYTGSLAKWVRVWMQVGSGVWFGDKHPRNFQACILAHLRQSISQGEVQGMLPALLARAEGEQMVVVLDNEYVFNGITKWSTKWRRHGWRNSSGEMGSRGNVSTPGARRASFVTRALPVDCCR